MNTSLPETNEIKTGDFFNILRKGVPMTFTGELSEYVLTQLDAPLDDLAANTVQVTGAAWGVTTDGHPVFLPPGGASVDTGTGVDWIYAYDLVDPATGLIRDDKLPSLIIAGLRTGTRAELDAADPPLLYNEPAWESDTQVFRVGSVRFPAPATATETAEGVVELATEAEVLAADGTANDAVVRAKHMRVKVESAKEGALSIGDLGGDPRGTGSITIQSSRGATTQIASGNYSTAIGALSTASGNYSTAIGTQSTASGNYSTAIGLEPTASGLYSTAIGLASTAIGDHSIAIGDYATASGLYSTTIGYYSTANDNYSTTIGYHSTAIGTYSTTIGYYSTASANGSTAIGHRAKSDTANAQELGFWNSVSVRGSAIRVHGTGYVALSAPKTDTAFTDGGATAGSEPDGTVMRSGLAFRVSTAGNLIATYCDGAGAITTLDLGAMA